MTNETALLRALEELLEQIDSLEGVTFTRDTEAYKAEACWDYALIRARALVRKLSRPVGA